MLIPNEAFLPVKPRRVRPPMIEHQIVLDGIVGILPRSRVPRSTQIPRPRPNAIPASEGPETPIVNRVQGREAELALGPGGDPQRPQGRGDANLLGQPIQLLHALLGVEPVARFTHGRVQDGLGRDGGAACFGYEREGC